MPTKESLLCNSCGYKEAVADVEVRETVKKKVSGNSEGKEIQETMPTIVAECPKCGNKEAFFYTQQTRASDEAETQFFICKQCKHKWRKC